MRMKSFPLQGMSLNNLFSNLTLYRSPRKSLKENSLPDLKLEESPHGNLANTSPREVVQAAVSNFCEDTFAMVEERVHKQRRKSKEFNNSNSSRKTSPRPAAETPREVVLNAVSNFCEDVIAVAEIEAVKVLSPRPPASPRDEKKESVVPATNPSPKKAQKGESTSNRGKGKGEKRSLDSPTKQPSVPTSHSDSELSDVGIKGQKISRIPPPKKVKHKISAPTKSEDPEVPQTTDSLNGHPPTVPKGNKDISKRLVKENKKPMRTKGISPSPSGDGLLPPINRPSPPSGERNHNQNENPRRKMSRYSSKDDGKKENGDSNLPNVTPSNQKIPREKPSKSVPNHRILDSDEDGLLINREQSKSAQMAENHTSLPPINGITRSDTTPRGKKRKKPLFLRLEDKAKRIQMEIEREKVGILCTSSDISHLW